MFEYDKNKSITNKEKHGIDFETAKDLWNDPNRLIIPVRLIDEPRYILIGELRNEIWSAVFTIRSENIRIISVRKSRKNEKEIYKSI